MSVSYHTIAIDTSIEKPISSGSRVNIFAPHSLEQDKIIRVPKDPNKDSLELDGHQRLKSWFGSFVPNTEVRLVRVDGKARKLLVVDRINSEVSQYPIGSKSLNRVLNDTPDLEGKVVLLRDIKKFIDICKKCFAETNSLPDLAGKGNVITSNNKLYIIDFNGHFIVDIHSYNPDTMKKSLDFAIESGFQQAKLTENKKITISSLTEQAFLQYAQDTVIPLDEQCNPLFDISLDTLYRIEKALLTVKGNVVGSEKFNQNIRNEARERGMTFDELFSLMSLDEVFRGYDQPNNNNPVPLLHDPFYAALRSATRRNLVNKIHEFNTQQRYVVV